VTKVPPAEHGEQRPDGLIRVQMIRTDQLRRNSYNPNKLTKEQSREYVAEVRRLGMLPKAIVVRPIGEDLYSVVDGEHGLDAAIEEDMALAPSGVSGLPG
jgi:ParB-like chromosome segregation protein Spo0J